MNSGMQIGHKNDFYFLNLLLLLKKIMLGNSSVLLGNSLFSNRNEL